MSWLPGELFGLRNKKWRSRQLWYNTYTQDASTFTSSVSRRACSQQCLHIKDDNVSSVVLQFSHTCSLKTVMNTLEHWKFLCSMDKWHRAPQWWFLSERWQWEVLCEMVLVCLPLQPFARALWPIRVPCKPRDWMAKRISNFLATLFIWGPGSGGGGVGGQRAGALMRHPRWCTVTPPP